MVEFIYGIIAGVAVSFAGYAIIEGIKSRNFKKNIKNLVKLELTTYSNFLEKFLNEPDPRYDSIIRAGSKELRDEANLLIDAQGKFNIFNFNTLSSETKARVFDIDTLTKLELTYQKIRIYGFHREYGSVSTMKAKTEEFKKTIDEAISKLN